MHICSSFSSSSVKLKMERKKTIHYAFMHFRKQLLLSKKKKLAKGLFFSLKKTKWFHF